jgi:hypothetical protein
MINVENEANTGVDTSEIKKCVPWIYFILFFAVLNVVTIMLYRAYSSISLRLAETCRGRCSKTCMKFVLRAG